MVQLKVGSISTVVHVALLLLAINTWADAFFGFEQFPRWALEDAASQHTAAAAAALTNGTISMLNTTAL